MLSSVVPLVRQTSKYFTPEKKVSEDQIRNKIEKLRASFQSSCEVKEDLRTGNHLRKDFLEARELLGRIKKIDSLSESLKKEVATFKKEFLARRLRIGDGVLDREENKGFKEFVEEHYLHVKLEHFGDSVRVNDDGIVEVRLYGDYVDWREVKNHPKIKWNETGGILGKGMMNADYCCEKGFMIENQDFEFACLKGMDEEALCTFIEKNLIVYKTDPHPSGEWEFQVQLEAADKPRLSGDHSSFRFVTPKGQIISMGAYRDEFSLMRQVMTLRSHEPGEFYTCHGTVKRTRFKVDKEKWVEALIEVLKLRRDPSYVKPYCVQSHNCSAYLLSIMDILGINYDMQQLKIHLLEQFSPTTYKVLCFVPPLLKAVTVSIVFSIYLLFDKGGKICDRISHFYGPDDHRVRALFKDILDIWRNDLSFICVYRFREIQDNIEKRLEKSGGVFASEFKFESIS